MSTYVFECAICESELTTEGFQLATCPVCDTGEAKEELTEPTLRDQFAMAALSGILSRQDYDPVISEEDASFVAEDAYRVANVMMKRRE